ncbi:MAG: VWA domain-containing protein [Acidobacteriia bacterium]|nr:VWA domain-containing protein [Terriglobia bacterium]
MIRTLRWGVFLALLVCSFHTTPAQTPATIELVAYNKENQTVKDLSTSDIELRVDGRMVTLDSLKWETKRPPRMILLVDTSYTAMNNRTLMKDLVTAFIDIKPPQLEMAIATINVSQQFLSSYQRSPDELVSTLQQIKFGGIAPLSQDILASLSQFDSKTSGTSKEIRKVLVAFSDGTDDSPSNLWGEVQRTLVSRGYAFYAINHIKALKTIFDFKYLDKELIRLTEETGGRAFRLNGLEDVGRVAREIYDRETNTYLATLNSDAKVSSADLNRFKIKSRRKDVRIDVVAVH